LAKIGSAGLEINWFDRNRQKINKK